MNDLRRCSDVASVAQVLKAYAFAKGTRVIQTLRSPRAHHILVGLIVLRIELLRVVLANTQCSALTWEPLVPFIFACYDYWTNQRRQKVIIDEERPDTTAYEALAQRAIRSRLRYLVVVGAFSFAALTALATTLEPRSTYICAATLRNRWLIPFLRRCGTAADVLIAYYVTESLCEHAAVDESDRGKSLTTRVSSLGSTVMVNGTSPWQ